jgi:hypothetical protein
VFVDRHALNVSVRSGPVISTPRSFIARSHSSAGRLFAPTALHRDLHYHKLGAAIAVLPFHREMTAKYSGVKSSSPSRSVACVDDELAGSTTTVISQGPRPFVSWSAIEIKFFHALLSLISTVRRLDGLSSTTRLQLSTPTSQSLYPDPTTETRIPPRPSLPRSVWGKPGREPGFLTDSWLPRTAAPSFWGADGQTPSGPLTSAHCCISILTHPHGEWKTGIPSGGARFWSLHVVCRLCRGARRGRRDWRCRTS